jgi:hypothetical protein
MPVLDELKTKFEQFGKLNKMIWIKPGNMHEANESNCVPHDQLLDLAAQASRRRVPAASGRGGPMVIIDKLPPPAATSRACLMDSDSEGGYQPMLFD